MQPDVTWDGDSEQRFLDRIAAESARLGRLVDDLLDFSAIESGVMRLQRDWCDLRARRRGGRVLPARPSRPPPCRSTATRPAGRVGRPRPARAGVRQPAQQRVSPQPARDPGDAWAPASSRVDGAARRGRDQRHRRRRRLPRRARRARRSTRLAAQRSRSAGAGPRACRSPAASSTAHGGDDRARARASRHAFRIRLPVEAAAPTARRRPATSDRRGCRAAGRRRRRPMPEADGQHPGAARRGRPEHRRPDPLQPRRARASTRSSPPTGCSALQLLETEEPDIVLLDLMLPEADGFELCRQIRERSVGGGDRRLGARRRTRQGHRAQHGRRRLHDQAVQRRGAAGADHGHLRRTRAAGAPSPAAVSPSGTS